ncbi:MAG: hypothetical protein R3Y04_00900 [Rikenellaceae bacterium]
MVRVLLSVLLLFLCSCRESQSQSDSKWVLSSSHDLSMLFFSGEYSSSDGVARFKDCVTGRGYRVDGSTQMAVKIDGEYQKLKNQHGESIYCTLRGAIESDSVLVISQFMGFQPGESCSDLGLTLTYIGGNDTLVLLDDYTFILKWSEKPTHRGVWGRNYSDQGFLIVDSLNSTQFIINFGQVNTPRNPSLMFKNLEGENEVLVPEFDN